MSIELTDVYKAVEYDQPYATVLYLVSQLPPDVGATVNFVDLRKRWLQQHGIAPTPRQVLNDAENGV